MDMVSLVLICVFLFMCLCLFWFWFCFGNCVKRRQKTRSPQPRRTPAATRPRHSLGAQEPTIYISPSNLPPPPKYEYMAPPSYEEVVGVHYPNFGAQPIAQPISTALAQASAQAEGSSAQHDTAPSISVVNEQRRISVAVAST